MSPRRASTLLAALLLLSSLPLRAANWPGWRGPEGTGITQETELPLSWSATQNVRWKVALPERGNSTPIVWGDRIFLTQAVGDRRTVLCLDRKDGHQIWQEGPTASAPERSHPTNPPCSGSPVCDGQRVAAWFGSAGLWCWDMAGKELWHVDLATQDHEWGYASSPVFYKDLCILPFGPGKRSFLVALDKHTGKEVWRSDQTPREPDARADSYAGKPGSAVGSWSTPVLMHVGDHDELLMTWPERIVAHDPATGKELWSCAGLSPLVYTSAVIGEGVVVGAGGYNGSSAAIKAGGSGEVTSQRLWQKLRDKQRIGSGVIFKGYFYAVNVPGTVQCIELLSGKVMWEERVMGSAGRSETWSSLVLSGERLYLLNQSSDTVVLKASPHFEKLSVNALDDGLCNASVAVSDGALFLRTHKHLWCIGQ